MARSASNPLQLPKELTYRQGRDCLLRLRPLVTGHADAQVVLDASAVKVFDSAALAVLLACRRCPGGGQAAHRRGSAQGAAVHGRAVWRGRLADARSVPDAAATAQQG
jgi:phospholipid transport system transporter-binding protein